MGTGLTFEEYIDLKLRPHSRADRAFHEVVDEAPGKMFPMALVSAANHLRSRGYDCRPESLELLVRNGAVTPAAPDAWSRADVDAAAEHFEDCNLLTPYAMMCVALGCRYSAFLRSLREASERESAKYGRHVRADDQLFVMHRVPPRGIVGPDGQLRDITPAIISFTLADDIREKLERGEEV
jgi:hypothetical protein